MNKLELQKTANEIRKGIVTAVHSAKSGHPGGSLSAADIFTYLYFEELNIDPENPKKEDRDRFVLSKGHVAPGLYSTLAHRGYFPVEDLITLRHVGSYLQGHPDMKHIPGVDMSSGSLLQWVWHCLQSLAMTPIVCIHCWVTEKFRKVRYGKLRCLPVSENWIIL